MKAAFPDPRLEFDPAGMREPDREFFLRETTSVARDLLGCWMARRHDGRWYGGRIVEVEAYLGARDRAAHSWNSRRTRRVEPMYSLGGYLYVYFVYGMHHCANVVTREEGTPEAVLIRALEGPAGCPPGLASGPGRLCRALGITVAHSGIDLLESAEIRIFRRPRAKVRAAVSPRIGIGYAGEARDWPLRYFDPRSPAVSGRKGVRR